MAPFRSTLSSLLILCLAILQFSDAFKLYIDSAEPRIGCGGMYAPTGGKNNSEIRVVMDRQSTGNAVVVVFEWGDHKYVGKIDPTDEKPVYICDSGALKAGLCAEADLGKAIIDRTVNSTVQTTTMDFSKQEEQGIQFFEYQISKAGYYCIIAWPVQINNVNSDFSGIAEFNNHYGPLAGIDYPKLLFYGTLSLLYMCIGIVWMVLCARNWREILMVQHFISGVIFFLMVEMAFNWGFWDDYNKRDTPSVGLLVTVSILNSGRNSISFFMLLIVCMGYGVVRPTLGSTMKRVIVLTLVHFLFGIIYSAGTMSPIEDVSAMIVLMAIVPLALTMSTFYIWTFHSLTSTIATLNLRRQTEKVKMYTRLRRLLAFSLMVLCAFFVINTLNLMNMDTEDWRASHWRIRWFLLDGWLNILYFVIFTAIVVLWRPTENNKRYGIDQLETDDFDDVDEHSDHNNARAAEAMGLTGMKLRPQRRDYELDEDEVAVFDIGDEDDDEDDEDEDDHEADQGRPLTRDLEAGGSGRPSPTRATSSRDASPGLLSGPFTDDSERERRRLEVSKMN
ncbi:hypothetical protein BGW38_000387 [Lunasporangiospora selenospora]|uniref:Uncharacterized protein n=1 Tax=Lunasporangiospora selenospora TaxID=979761 RepID=A0A9P6FUY4_9FUNG|nr:hypothetical protein BGW38_000387 [Lunasporangiospora selenospora]